MWSVRTVQLNSYTIKMDGLDRHTTSWNDIYLLIVTQVLCLRSKVSLPFRLLETAIYTIWNEAKEAV